MKRHKNKPCNNTQRLNLHRPRPNAGKTIASIVTTDRTNPHNTSALPAHHFTTTMHWLRCAESKHPCGFDKRHSNLPDDASDDNANANNTANNDRDYQNNQENNELQTPSHHLHHPRTTTTEAIYHRCRGRWFSDDDTDNDANKANNRKQQNDPSTLRKPQLLDVSDDIKDDFPMTLPMTMIQFSDVMTIMWWPQWQKDHKNDVLPPDWSTAMPTPSKTHHHWCDPLLNLPMMWKMILSWWYSLKIKLPGT